MLCMPHNTLDVPQKLREKWESLFDSLDLNNDGQVDWSDFDVIQSRLAKDANLTVEHREKISKLADDVFYGHLKRKDKAPFTQAEFVLNFYHKYKEGLLENMVKDVRTLIFHCMDRNGDGFIDIDEFQLFYRVTGKTGMTGFDEVFNLIDKNKDGKISLDEYLDAFVRYMCDKDIPLRDLPVFGLKGNE